MDHKIVIFHPLKSLTDAIDTLSLLNSNTNLILWYFGSKCFKLDGVKYYQKVIRRIVNIKTIDKIILYDLTAWGSFFCPRRTILEFNPNTDIVNSFDLDKIYALKSNIFFDWMCGETDDGVIEFIRSIISREELYTHSKTFEEKNIKLVDIFGSIPMINSILSLDVAKTYSAIQYIEALYIVYHLVKTGVSNICFFLPNDEQKYYISTCFEKDLIMYLKLMKVDDLSGICVNFVAFMHSTNIKSRPYNAGNQIVSVLTADNLK